MLKTRLGRLAERGVVPSRLVCLLPLVACSIVGCSDGLPERAAVEGIVRFEGSPLPRGTIRFVPKKGRSASGTIASDGTFTLGTYDAADGALIGPHRVAITATKGDAKRSQTLNIDESYAAPENESLIPEFYNQVELSGLEFDVEPGIVNKPEFELSKP